MVLGFIKAVLNYHRNYYLYDIIIIGISLLLGIIIALLKKKFHKESCNTRYLQQDMAFFCLTQLAGNIMLLIFQQEMKFLVISILLFLIALLLLRNLSFSIISMIVSLMCVAILFCCLKLFNFNMFWIYSILRVCSICVNILISSDLLLFLLSRKSKKNAELKHVFFQSLLIILCFLVFIMPSDLNFVNASGYHYGDLINIIFNNNNKSQNPVENPNPDSNPDNSPENSPDMLVIDKNQILTEKADYIYEYSTENLSEYSTAHLNCHEFKTWYLNDSDYQNQILNSVIDLTKNYQINPSYLFNYILKYNSEKSKAIPVSNDETNHFNFDINFDKFDAQALESDVYASEIYGELMKNFSMLSEENTTFPLSKDENPFYSYFAFCDEQAIYYITLYLTLDENNQIIASEYSILQFIDFNQETELITMKDYATELQAIYDTAFENDFIKNSGRYDMILKQDDNTVYFRQYYCNYKK
ncbi:MAG: hypothetical protein HDT22_11670 [Ruminococcus sp.]|nr:hypothetical protein [Ruminococcus sp.]